MAQVEINPFKINIPDTEFLLLREKLDKIRWPDEVDNGRWQYGTNLAYLKQLTNFWRTDFDWRHQENKINEVAHFTATMDGQLIHFIHEKGKGKTATPIVLLHGWPFSFIQMLKIIPLLTEADEQGHSFTVIIPSLIGFGFSAPATQPGLNLFEMTKIFHRLVADELGYKKILLRGSDLGMGICRYWAGLFPDNVIGLHLSGSNPFISRLPENLSGAEKEFVENASRFVKNEGAYAALHSTKPQTLAYALNDSPVGLASWLLEKFNSWSDNNGDIENSFRKDDLLLNISLYWFTNTINSSMRIYFESAHHVPSVAVGKISTPTAFLMLKNDIINAPRSWEERDYSNIIQWTSYNKGGHFAEWELPEVVADDLRKFTARLRMQI